MEGSLDVLLDVWGVVNLVGDEELLPREGLLVLVGDFLPFLVLHLSLSLQHSLQSVPNRSLIVYHIEVGVPCIGSLQEEVGKVELLVVGFEVGHAQPNEGEEVSVAKWDLRVGVHEVI